VFNIVEKGFKPTKTLPLKSEVENVYKIFEWIKFSLLNAITNETTDHYFGVKSDVRNGHKLYRRSL
jgi:hypothetical protein